MINITLIDIIGFVGLFLILVAYELNITKKLKTTSIKYSVMNVFGSAILAYYAIQLGSVPFFLLQLVWGFSALIILIKTIRL